MVDIKVGYYLNANSLRQDDDYFACDDLVIRSPTYYTRTARLEERFLIGPSEGGFGGLQQTDLKSLLTPMWDKDDDSMYEEQKTDQHIEKGNAQQTIGKPQNTQDFIEDDEAMEFEKKIDDQIQKTNSQSNTIDRKSTRKPEDVKFRTFDEERASLKLQGKQARKSSVEERVNVESFEFLGLIGQGSYGKVFMAKMKKSGKFYAIKMIQKHKIMKAGKQQEVFRERQALITLDHPNIVKMYWSFDDKKYLYFVLDLAPNGELFSIIQREGKLKHELSQFLSAEIITILEYMHSKGIAHRDLKPSNLLFDENHHLKLCDFGCSKLEQVKARIRGSICIEMEQSKTNNNDENDTKTNTELNQRLQNVQTGALEKKATLVGTEDYISPEVLAQESSGRPADLWSLGVIIFMMISGRSPFKAHNQIQTFHNISTANYTFTDEFSPEARDLITKLLQKDPTKRLGTGEPGSDTDYHTLKSHPYFKGIDFEKLFLMPTPYNFKKFQRSTLRQQLMDQKQADESNDVILTTMATEDDITIEHQVHGVISANVVLSAHLKKKNRLGFFYKRIVTLTDEPKLYYLKSSGNKDRHKHIHLDPENTKLERLDKTKFKVIDFRGGKKHLFVFRCHDANECETWIMQICNMLDKMKNKLPSDKQAINQFKQGSQSHVNVIQKMQSHESQNSQMAKSYISKSATKSSTNLHEQVDTFTRRPS